MLGLKWTIRKIYNEHLQIAIENHVERRIMVESLPYIQKPCCYQITHLQTLPLLLQVI